MAAMENRYIRPVIHAVALAISLGGIIYSNLRTKGSKPSTPPSDRRSEFDSGKGRSDYHARQKLEESDEETISSNGRTSRTCKFTEREDYEREIKNLKNMVKILQDRERGLEIQMLEYYGLKEQETAVMELQNRLKLSDVEAKLFSLKIEALQADNRRLEAQVADNAKLVSELEGARAKIKGLKKKLKFEVEQNKELTFALQQKVKKLHDDGHHSVMNSLDFQLKLQRMKELEEEAEELGKSNNRLKLENYDLAHKLEYTQMLAHSVLEDQEAEELREESHQLREKNEDLLKKMEQLQADHSANVKEVVNLRWVNACLRCELRHLKTRLIKTTGSNLSKSSIPESEEKVEHLKTENANKEGLAGNGINFLDSDFDQWSSSHSCLTESGELDDSSADNPSINKTDRINKTKDSIHKTKFFSKLKKLMKGKDSHGSKSGSSMTRVASETDIVELSSNSSGSRSSVAIYGHNGRSKCSSLASSASYSDLEKLSLHANSAKYSSSSGNSEQNQLPADAGTFQKSDLVKFSHAIETLGR